MKTIAFAILAFAGLACVNANAQTPVGCGNTASYDGGTSYVLTGNITNTTTSPCLEFDHQSSQDTLDCQGYSINTTYLTPLLVVQNSGNVLMKNCTLNYGTAFTGSFGVEVLTGGTLQTAEGTTTGQSNFWNYANLQCSGGQQVLLQYDQFDRATIDLDTCSSATYPSSLYQVGQSFPVGFSSVPSVATCLEVDSSPYVTINYFGSKRCPGFAEVGLFRADNYLTIQNSYFEGNWDRVTSRGGGTDDGIVICAQASSTGCSPSSTGTTSVTGLDIEYTQSADVYDACLEFVGWADHGSVYQLTCSFAGITAVGAYWNTSMDHMTFNYVGLYDMVSGTLGPLKFEQDNSSLHGHGESFTNIQIYNTSIDTGSADGTSNLGQSFTTNFDNYYGITVANNEFGDHVVFQSGGGAVTDGGGNLCHDSTPSYDVTCH